MKMDLKYPCKYYKRKNLIETDNLKVGNKYFVKLFEENYLFDFNSQLNIVDELREFENCYEFKILNRNPIFTYKEYTIPPDFDELHLWIISSKYNDNYIFNEKKIINKFTDKYVLYDKNTKIIINNPICVLEAKLIETFNGSQNNVEVNMADDLQTQLWYIEHLKEKIKKAKLRYNQLDNKEITGPISKVLSRILEIKSDVCYVILDNLKGENGLCWNYIKEQYRKSSYIKITIDLYDFEGLNPITLEDNYCIGQFEERSVYLIKVNK